jgi:hypothetical protein
MGGLDGPPLPIGDGQGKPQGPLDGYPIPFGTLEAPTAPCLTGTLSATSAWRSMGRRQWHNDGIHGPFDCTETHACPNPDKGVALVGASGFRGS